MCFRISVLVLAVILSGPSALAGYKDDIRFTELAAELGVLMPTGAGIHVGQVELRSGFNYLPDMANVEFGGKTITPQSGASGTSNHATTVGLFFYGNQTSIAPGITQIDSFEANDWMTGGYLNSYEALQFPLNTDVRIFNHSWVANNTSALEILQRLDYAVETFDVLQFVGVNNDPDGTAANLPLLSHSLNAISVGRTNGQHVTGTLDLSDSQGVYVAGRTAPHLVTQNWATSFAAPVAAAAAALLLETADTNPGLSNGSYLAGGRTIQHAASSEVIKAALMAGADRDGIVGSYSVTTANGLDSTFGAGELDIFNSYHILAAGEQERSDVSAPGSRIDLFGFDYEPSFDDDQTASYQFNYASAITASLVWNVDIADRRRFNGQAKLANFDLLLFEVGAGGNTLVASSQSTIDNTENLWISGLNPDAEYVLQVQRNDALGLSDFGLAWVIEELIPGDANGDRMVGAADYTVWSNSVGLFDGNATISNADWTGDGIVDTADYTVWADHFGLDLSASGAASGSSGISTVMFSESTSTAAPIPEPSAIVLFALGLVGLLSYGRRRRRS